MPRSSAAVATDGSSRLRDTRHTLVCSSTISSHAERRSRTVCSPHVLSGDCCCAPIMRISGSHCSAQTWGSSASRGARGSMRSLGRSTRAGERSRASHSATPSGQREASASRRMVIGGPPSRCSRSPTPPSPPSSPRWTRGRTDGATTSSRGRMGWGVGAWGGGGGGGDGCGWRNALPGSGCSRD